MFFLYVEAPFAAFRAFTAGWYRPTAPFLTPSAAYGLVLNVAGVDSRLREGEAGHDGRTPASLMRRGLPTLEIAVGAPCFRLAAGGRRVELPEGSEVFPRVQSIFQQLHNYPVGKGNKVDDPDNPGAKVYTAELAERRAGGTKPNITPVRREFLSPLRAVIAVKGEAVEQRVADALQGRVSIPRYGVPFLGDNSYLLDRLELIEAGGDVHWFERLTEAGGRVKERAARLTVLIDRADLSQTTSSLYAPGEPAPLPSDDAWTTIAPPSVVEPAAPKKGARR